MIAWDLLGLQDTIDITHLIRIKGGRTLYEQASLVNSHDGSQNVRLSRIQPERGGLHQISRNVPFDTEVELVPIKVYVAMAQHYDQQAQKVKAFYCLENAHRHIAQQAKIMEGYNYATWLQDKAWVVWNKETDQNVSVFWVSEQNKEDVLDLF